ncbi:MAG: PilZ domain-containing protein [Leptospiraceae bacterium]|nr:PilZ domain-containing protein [Leptospiraceae bacterium]
MSSDFRKATRVYHKDLNHYKVNFSMDGIEYRGKLGNISENGMCAIMPTDFQAPQGSELQGYLLYEPLKEKIEVQGKVAWKTDYEHQNEIQQMFGMEFTGSVEFPEYLMALTMSFEN